MLEFRSRLALSHNNLGIVLKDTGKPAEAEVEYRAALAIFQKLADDNPTVSDFRSRLSRIHYSRLGELLCEAGKPAQEARKPSSGRRLAAPSRNWSTTTTPTPHSASRMALSHDSLGLWPFCRRQASRPRPRLSIAAL